MALVLQGVKARHSTHHARITTGLILFAQAELMGGEREELLRRLKAHAGEPAVPEMDLVACILHSVVCVFRFLHAALVLLSKSESPTNTEETNNQF